MIKEFRGKKIELNDELVKTFENFMHEEVDDDLIEIYINAQRQNISKDYIVTLSEDELKHIVEQGLTSELKVGGCDSINV